MIDILELPNVESLSKNSVNGLTTIEARYQPPSIKCHCGDKFAVSKMERKFRFYPDIPIRAEQVMIKLEAPTGRCQRCKRACPLPPFIHSKRTMTERCHEYVGSLALYMPASRIASLLSISPSTVERIVRTQRKVINERLKPYCLTAIGIDEVLIRGQYRNIIVDLDKNIIVDLLPNHDVITLQSWLNQFGSLLPNVDYVTMDQTERYRTIFKARCPNAMIIYDKFHFVSLVNKAIGIIYANLGWVTSTRTKEASKQRRVLCAREKNLDMPGQLLLNGILSNSEDLKTAHKIKEALHDILDKNYSLKDRTFANAAIRQWESTIPKSMLGDPFEKVVSAVNNWRPQVVNMLLANRIITSHSKPIGYYTNSPT